MFGVVDRLAALLDFEPLFFSSLGAFSFLPDLFTGVFLLLAAAVDFVADFPLLCADFLPAADLDGVPARELARLVPLRPRSYGCRLAPLLPFFAPVALDASDFLETGRPAGPFDYLDGDPFDLDGVLLGIFLFVAIFIVS